MAVLPTGIGPVTNGYQIERSLRFNSADSAYLNRTPASAGNRRTFTWSGWVKRGALSSSASYFLFAAGSFAGSTNTSFRILNDSINIYWGGTGGPQWTATAVLRDPSAWYHLVFAFDTTQATLGNRLKLYVNGVQSTVWSLQESTGLTAQNSDLYINNNQQHNLGASGTPDNYFNGYMTEINFVDGQALTPSDFGETDTNTGVWKPKAYTGTYGTNGFYLPFKTASQWSGYFDGTGDKLTSSTNAIAATGEFSVEAWVYQTARTVTSDQHIFSQYTSGATAGRWYLRFNGTTVAFTTGLGTSVSCATTVNTGTWYHVCVTRDSSNRVRVFLNGVLDGTAVISGSLDTAASTIGATQTANYWQGYISNVRAVSGQIPTAYQTASTTVGASIFTPSTSQLTAVSGTSLLTCQSSTFVDNSGLSRTITTAGDVITQQFSPFTLDVTDDHSGQGNNWQPNNLDLRTTGVGADILVDSPTSYGTDTGVGGEVRGNYCTLNPLASGTNTTLANGSLDFSCGTAQFSTSVATLGLKGGKWYWEVTANSNGIAVGIMSSNANLAPSALNLAGPGESVNGWHYQYNANRITNNTAVSYGATFSTSDVIGVALDLDAGTIVFYKNGTSQGTAYSGLSTLLSYFPAVGDGSSGISTSCSCNFGQRPFAYTAPSGFKALCTQNLPTPTIGATSTTQANDYFNAVLYTADGTSPKSRTGIGFAPDFLWFKDRTSAFSHALYDTVRGTSKGLQTNSTAAENSYTLLTAFGSDGFTTSDDGTAGNLLNYSTDSYVTWAWNAGGSNATNTAGTITSTVRANTTSGFSIVTYTGTGANATVGHGIGTAPSMIFVKGRSGSGSSNSWRVYHSGANASPASGALYLNSTSAFTTDATAWNSTAPTSNVFSLGTDAGVNSTGTYVAYCFAPVAGYSAFGSYVGNGSTDGPFVFTNFRPRWILIKAYDATYADQWRIYDTVRKTFNPTGVRILANSANAELDSAVQLIDILSNGFKLRNTDGGLNGSGSTLIYAAFAENPFKYSLAR